MVFLCCPRFRSNGYGPPHFAWTSLLQGNRTINLVLQALGITSHPTTLLQNRLAVIVGMVHYVRVRCAGVRLRCRPRL